MPLNIETKRNMFPATGKIKPEQDHELCYSKL